MEEEDDQVVGNLSVLVEKGIRNPLHQLERDSFHQWMGRWRERIEGCAP